MTGRTQQTHDTRYALSTLGRVSLFVKKILPNRLANAITLSLPMLPNIQVAFSKKIATSLLVSAFLVSVLGSAMMVRPVQANVFDSLLKVILPFYQGKNDTNNKAKDSTQTPAQAEPQTEIDTTTSVQDHESSNLDNAPFEIDDSDVNAQTSELPSILLDDSLSADDTTLMLDEPDLYALLMAEFYADRGDIAQALSIYKAESFKKNATAVFERALALSIEYEEPIESLHFATAWQTVNTDHIPAWFYVAHLALKAKDYNQATQMIAMILRYDDRADLTQILTGIVPQDPTDQRNLFFALQELDDNNASISALRAGLLLNARDYPPALLHINKALTIEPKNLAFINLKIDILRQANKTDEMWAFIRKKRAEIPTEKELHLYEIRHQLDVGQQEKAWELLKVANKQTKNAEVSLLTAFVGIDTHHLQEANEILKQLAKNPDYTSRANYYLGISYERSGDIDNAMIHYQQVKDREHVLDARTKMVGFYLINDDVDKAMATLVRLREEYEVFETDSYILQAEILMSQGKKEQASELLSNANRENPDDDRLLFASYKILEDELDFHDKEETLNKLLAIDPYHLEYQLAYAKIRLMQNPDDTEAYDTALNISQLEVSDPAYDSQLQLDALMVLANHAYAKGEYRTVIDYLQTPYDVAPSLPVGIMLLRAYQGLGDGETVARLLAELQQNFAFGNRSDGQTQQY